MIDYGDVDPAWTRVAATFALVIPPNFQRDALAAIACRGQCRRHPNERGLHRQWVAISSRSSPVKSMSSPERYRGTDAPPVDLVLRAHASTRHWTGTWFASVVQIINHHAVVHHPDPRSADPEREHGTIEHLLMPVTPAQIMLPNWSMAWSC